MGDTFPDMEEVEESLLSEWQSYQAQPERFAAALAATDGQQISRVLDVGCGAGQELLPFVRRRSYLIDFGEIAHDGY